MALGGLKWVGKGIKGGVEERGLKGGGGIFIWRGEGEEEGIMGGGGGMVVVDEG